MTQELKRRTRVVRVFPNEAYLLRLVSTLLTEISQLEDRKKLPQHGLIRPTHDLMPAETKERKLVPRHFLWVARAPKMARLLGGFLPSAGLITRADSNRSGAGQL